jgi:hypothetical protein
MVATAINDIFIFHLRQIRSRSITKSATKKRYPMPWTLSSSSPRTVSMITGI